jgi:hypothetical protein
MKYVLPCGSLWGVIRTSYWERSDYPVVALDQHVGIVVKPHRDRNNAPALQFF